MFKVRNLFVLAALLVCSGIFAGDYLESGTVEEALEVPNYTYLRLRDETGEVWIAVGKVPARQGDTVNYSGGVEMTAFHSETLGRTFDRILFVTHAEVVPSAEQSPTSPPHPMREPGQPAAAGTVQAGEIEPLSGGLTIREIVERAADLQGQRVQLRAKVIKSSPNILGRNWITLQDGSGPDLEQKLIVTTQKNAAIGAVLVLEGTVNTNVELGSGYHYDLLLEDAVLLNAAP